MGRDSAARAILSQYSEGVDQLDSGILEYLLNEISGRSDPGHDDDIQDLVFSLLPDLALIEMDIATLISKLVEASDTTKSSATVTVESGVPSYRPVVDDENEDLEMLKDVLKKFDYPGENPIDSSTLTYIVEVWKTPDVGSEDMVELIKSYFSDIDSILDEEGSSAFLEAIMNLLDTIGSREGHSDGDADSNSARSRSKSDLELAMDEIKSDVRTKKVHTEEEIRERKALDAKFGQGVITPKYDEKGKAINPAKKPMVVFVQNDKAKSKLRYRDGVVVASKGEKFIVEKEEEYDGGSRGRVQPKGKRGAGSGGGWGKK